MTFVEILFLALSLSADSFVVSMSGSVTLGRTGISGIFKTAIVFGITQAACLSAGWISGYSVVAYISGLAHYIALVILSYLGISMIVSGIRNDSGSVDLSGFRNLALAAVATSIDAIAVGVSLAMGDMVFHDALLAVLLTLAITVAASAAGVMIGAASGRMLGNWARIAGGLVLVFIGFRPFIERLSCFL